MGRMRGLGARCLLVAAMSAVALWMPKRAEGQNQIMSCYSWCETVCDGSDGTCLWDGCFGGLLCYDPAPSGSSCSHALESCQ